MNLRKTLLSAAALVVPAGVLLVAVPDVASAAVVAQGSVNCPIVSGSGTLSPGLTPGGAPGGVKITFTAKVASPAGANCGANVAFPPGLVITGGTVTGSGFYNPPVPAAPGSACPLFAGPDVVGKIVAKVAWTTLGPPIAPSHVVYKNNPGTVVPGVPGDVITLAAPGGTAHKAGSFNLPAPAGPPNTIQLKTDIPGPGCGPGPWTNFNIVGGFVYL